MADDRISVGIITMNRREELLRTLGRLTALPEEPRVVVVDNGSDDGTPDAVRNGYPDVVVVEAGTNLGAAGRNLAVRAGGTPYVAFADDDSWWAPGALARAADLFDAHPRLGLLNGRILVGEEERLDPTCAVMAASPLAREPDLPGPSLLGFVACGAVVRAAAFLGVGGFSAPMRIGGEEALVAMDLDAAGWGLAYVDEVVVHHHPSAVRSPSRRRRVLRNDLWTTWLRRPGPSARAATVALATAALTDADARAALPAALAGLPWALSSRHPVGDRLEARLARVESHV